MQPAFIHLRLHTEYSLLDGLIRIDELIEHAVKNRMPALAITDESNLFATVKFYKAALKAGIKPIIGADCWVQSTQQAKLFSRVTLLCQNQTGYKNLTQLISRSYIQRQQQAKPVLQKEWLETHNAGLIALSGGREGEIGQAILMGKVEVAEALLQEWQTLFPERFYLELQRTGRPQEEEYLYGVIDLAQKQQVPVVATNDTRFLATDDFEAHEARVCIHAGNVLSDPRRPQHYSPQQYLRTTAEMQRLFADIPESLQNSVEIAKRCNLELKFGKTYLPNFPIPDGLTEEAYFTQQVEAGLEQRLAILLDTQAPDFANKKQEYADRLQRELNVINSMGFAGYFLIVADFIRWAKQNGIPVGPGRGSGAGSLVAYAIQITDLDPLQYDLLFERFLNPERISMPDFDVDFCMDGRDRVIDYVTQKYGRDAVSQIITYGSMAARAVVRDVGRVLGYPYGMVDKIAKLIPFELGITLDKALEQEEELKRRYEQEDEIRTLLDLAQKLEGLARNVGKHAAGVVMAPSELTDFTPLYCEPDSAIRVTQFDKDDIETIGLVKFDFLGLRTLTIIDWAVRTINRKRAKQNESLLDITRIPLDDAPTFALLQACATTAVFQLESRGMKDLVKRMQPDCMEDIIALVALFRPGPLQSGMTDDYINRKHGRAQVSYLHPALENILRPTYGIIVYQEQVMQIAQELAGYTLGAADLLRRAMGKKKAEEMAKQREIFMNGAKERGVKADISKPIFDLMEMFADYGFNKSHSAAYALITYQTAWLKAHYPAEFMAAVLSSDMDHTDKVVALLDECRNLKLTVLPPEINRSQYQFTVDATDAIVYGLGAIKGMGEAAVENIIMEREQHGAYKDLFDFCQRVDTRKVNRRTLEALIRSGTFDALGPNRASQFLALETALHAAEQEASALAAGQQDLFSAVAVQQKPTFPDIAEWPTAKRLQHEKEVLGFYLSGHPLNRYRAELSRFTTGGLAALEVTKNQSVVLAGWVIGLRTLFTKRGDRMAIVTIEDTAARLDVTLFSEVYNNHKDLLVKDSLLIIEGEVSVDDFTGGHKLLARQLYNMTKIRESYARALIIKLNANSILPETIEKISQTLRPFCSGKCPVVIEYERQDVKAQWVAAKNWYVQPHDALLNSLTELLGDEAVTMSYAEA